MSYEIVYDKQFVKVNNKGTEMVIPMILAGSSNCYEHSGRRERSWFPFTVNVGLLGKVEDYVAYWENVRKETKERIDAEKRDQWHTQYSDNSFGYFISIALGGKYCSKTTFGNITGIFTTGAKKALTIEQLASEGVSIEVKSGYYPSNKREELGIKPFSCIVKSDEELLNAIAECNKAFEGTNISTTIGFIGMGESKPKWLRKKFFTAEPKVKVPTVVDETYNIKVVGYGYFLRETRGGLKYTSYGKGKVYVNRAEAIRKLEQLQSKSYKCTFEIEVSHEPIEVMV